MQEAKLMCLLVARKGTALAQAPPTPGAVGSRAPRIQQPPLLLILHSPGDEILVSRVICLWRKDAWSRDQGLQVPRTGLFFTLNA